MLSAKLTNGLNGLGNKEEELNILRSQFKDYSGGA